jgi:hypothetical protein
MNGVIGFARDDFSVPDAHFQDTLAKAVIPARGISNGNIIFVALGHAFSFDWCLKISKIAGYFS